MKKMKKMKKEKKRRKKSNIFFLCLLHWQFVLCRPLQASHWMVAVSTFQEELLNQLQPWDESREDLLRHEKSFYGNFSEVFRSFREVFRSFREVFRSFRELFEAFGRVRTHSDPLRYIRTHSEAIGNVSTFSRNFEFFWIFDSFFNVSRRNF